MYHSILDVLENKVSSRRSLNLDFEKHYGEEGPHEKDDRQSKE